MPVEISLSIHRVRRLERDKTRWPLTKRQKIIV